jgi:adenylyltransferase/sulfurtransferase
LKEVGGQGQQKLKGARVLVIGAGGLGSPLVLYLAAAGVGSIGIVDDDRVSLDNLQRQIAHDTDHIGEAKVLSAGAMARRLNPHVAIEPIEARLDASNAASIIGR